VGWLAHSPVERLRARLPDPLNRNRHIVVITDLRPAPPAGTPLVRMTPGLQLIGVVEGLEVGFAVPAPGDQALRVSLFPEGAALLCDDGALSLRVSTPDLLEIVGAHLTEARRKDISARLRAFHAEHEAALASAGERAREIVAAEIGADEVGQRLREDPVIRDALSRAVEEEITRRIDWDRVGRRALDSEAAEVAGELASEAGVVGPAWAVLAEGYAARWRGILFGAPARDPEDDFEGWWRPLNVFVPRWADGRRAALDKAGVRIADRFPDYQEDLARTGRDLAVDLARDQALEEKGLGAARAVAKDPALRAHVLERHGPDALARLERTGAALAADPELARRVRKTLDAGLELLAAFLRELLLDERGEGPNPLVVAAVRARLLGKDEPVLVVDDLGTGEPAREGQVFVSRTR
jgi:hypothetical protein